MTSLSTCKVSPGRVGFGHSTCAPYATAPVAKGRPLVTWIYRSSILRCGRHGGIRFLILADGRCLARRWWAYDAVIRVVAEQLGGSDAALALREWLLSLLPEPDDEQHVGYGQWAQGPFRREAHRSRLASLNGLSIAEAGPGTAALAPHPHPRVWPPTSASLRIVYVDEVEQFAENEPLTKIKRPASLRWCSPSYQECCSASFRNAVQLGRNPQYRTDGWRVCCIGGWDKCQSFSW